MKEKWKTLILSIIICFVGGVIGLLGKQLYHHWKFEKLYQSILVEGKNEVIFLGRPSCGFCNLFQPVLDDISEKYGITYRYINTDWLTKKELEKVLEKLEIRKRTFSTPRLIITEGSEIIDHQIGYMDDISLFHFFKKNGLIKEEEKFIDPYPNVERLSSADYFALFERKESAYLLIGRIGDPVTDGILKEVNNSNEISLKFVNPSIFFTEEEGIKFEETITEVQKGAEMPILLKIENGKIEKIMEKVTIKEIQKLK